MISSDIFKAKSISVWMIISPLFILKFSQTQKISEFDYGEMF